MSISEKINLIVYRYADKGIEVLMHETDNKTFILPCITPNVPLNSSDNIMDVETISLDNAKCIAVELNTASQELSSIEAIEGVAEKLHHLISTTQKNKYVALKELFKSVLPNEYALLKEFKEILSDRNSVRDL